MSPPHPGLFSLIFYISSSEASRRFTFLFPEVCLYPNPHFSVVVRVMSRYELTNQNRLHIRHGNLDRRCNLPNNLYPSRRPTISRLGRFQTGRSIRFILPYVLLFLFSHLIVVILFELLWAANFSVWGVGDSMFQTYCYWIMSALTNDPRRLARYAGMSIID